VTLRLSLRLVVVGLVSLLAALLVITTLVPARPAPTPLASAAAGAQVWAMIEHLFHHDPPTAGAPPSGSVPVALSAPPASDPGGPVVAQLPPAAVVTPGGVAAIDRRAQAPRQAPTAAPPPAPVVAAPRVDLPAAPLPAPVPVVPAPSLLVTVTSLVANLVGLLTGG
jgi:hypothetical protein